MVRNMKYAFKDGFEPVLEEGEIDDHPSMYVGPGALGSLQHHEHFQKMLGSEQYLVDSTNVWKGLEEKQNVLDFVAASIFPPHLLPAQLHSTNSERYKFLSQYQKAEHKCLSTYHSETSIPIHLQDSEKVKVKFEFFCDFQSRCEFCTKNLTTAPNIIKVQTLSD